MRNIKLLIAYDGTLFCGWQRQKDQPTIQATIEDAISIMTGQKTALHGAGRTDAGVHALGMVANFHTRALIPCSGFKKGLNSMLPAGIRLLSVTDVEADFHARFNAKGKSYHYNLITEPILFPTNRLYNTHVPGLVHIDNMAACLELIRGEHDFSSFEAAGSRDISKKNGRGAVRTIYLVDIVTGYEPARLTIVIRGDGFLRHMVRNIIGTMIQVGTGKRSVNDFHDVLLARDRCTAGPTAPPCGLFLKEVFY